MSDSKRNKEAEYATRLEAPGMWRRHSLDLKMLVVNGKPMCLGKGPHDRVLDLFADILQVFLDYLRLVAGEYSLVQCLTVFQNLDEVLQ